jgi:hypothetical protein
VARDRKAYREANKPTLSAYNREWRLRNDYGLTAEEYDILLESQNGLCKICRGMQADGRRLAVDHDHKTGRVRGLLCDWCNRALGLFRDDPQLCEAAKEYLAA